MEQLRGLPSEARNELGELCNFSELNTEWRNLKKGKLRFWEATVPTCFLPKVTASFSRLMVFASLSFSDFRLCSAPGSTAAPLELSSCPSGCPAAAPGGDTAQPRRWQHRGVTRRSPAAAPPPPPGPAAGPGAARGYRSRGKHRRGSNRGNKRLLLAKPRPAGPPGWFPRTPAAPLRLRERVTPSPLLPDSTRLWKLRLIILLKASVFITYN